VAVLISPVLVGRRRELEVLQAAIERAVAGEPGVVVVGGEAGVGKTRIVEEAARTAVGAGARVLTGACVELGGEGVPLAPLVDVLRTLAATTPPEALDDLLGPARGELARLLPELDPGAAAPAPAQAGQASRLYELVLGVLGRLAREQPLMLVFEDLHWADRTTLDLFTFLVSTNRAAPLLLVGTYRSDEIHRRHALRPLLTSLERMRAVERLELSPFTRAETVEQLEAIAGGQVDPRLADEVFDRSEGNAFLAEEMLEIAQGGAGLDRLPPSLRDVLLARAEQLSESAQRVLRVAAVAGRRVPDRLLAAEAELPRPVLLDALREAAEHHLLVVDDTGYAFRHALVRDAVYDDILPAERVELHTGYGEAVEADPSLAGDEGSAAAALAHHWYAAHDLPRALPAAVHAARHASGGYAPADAARHLERALEIWPKVPDAAARTGLDLVGLIELAAAAALAAGDDPRALALVDQALARVDRERESTRAALLLERRAEALRWTGHGDQVAALEEAVELLPAEPPTVELAVVLAALANIRLLRGELDAARDAGERALAAARGAGAPQQEAGALITIGSATGNLGEPDAGLPALRDGLDVAIAIGDEFTAVRAYANTSDLLQHAARYEEARATAVEGLALASRVGLVGRFGEILTLNAAEPLYKLGRWREAEELLAPAIELNLPNPRSLIPYLLRGAIAAARGRYDDAARHLEVMRRVVAEGIDFQGVAAIAPFEAELALGLGDLAAARAAVARALADEHLRVLPRYAWQLVWLGVRTEADAATRARDRRGAPDAEIAARADELVEIAGALVSHSPESRGYAALVAAERGRMAGEPGTEAWGRATAAWREAGDVQRLAYALVRLAEAQLAQGDRPAATDAVREAAEIAGGAGAEPLASEALALARRGRLDLGDAAGPVAPGPAEADRFGLTDREREVLRHVADGRSNSEIASALYISRKTASVHVSNIIRKLGVTGRGEAAAVAHRLGLAA
jgi:DNA-binding CsgD family transcriptional regulator